MTAPPAICIALGFLHLWLGFFAGWTLGSVPLTLACAPFEALWIAGIAGATGAFAAVRYLYPQIASVMLSPRAMPVASDLPKGLPLLLWSASGIVLALSGLFFVATSNALPFWGFLVALGLVALLGRSEGIVRPAEKPASPKDAWIGIGVLVLVIIGLYTVLVRPDADDAFYLNLPIGLIAQHTCMMAEDTMYGADAWPILGSNYRVEALPTLTAALSWVSGLPVIMVAHVLLPAIWCLAWAATLAVIGHGVFGARWWVFAGLALLCSMALAGTLQTWGVHGITRLFHGKGPLVVIVFPLMSFFVARAAASGLAFGPSFFALFGVSTVALGLTANAIYLAPLALLFSLVAARIAWPHTGSWMRLGLIAAAAPPVAAGLWLLLFDKPVSSGEAANTLEVTDLGLWNMAADKLTLAVLMVTLIAAALAARTGPAGRWITAYLLAFLVLTLNPLLWPIYQTFVTGGLNFRLWWALPLPTFLAIGLTWVILQTSWMRTAATAVGGVLAVMALMPSGLIGMANTYLLPGGYKIPPNAARTVQDVLAAAPAEGTVLAPEEIAAWLPIWEDHPALVYSRRLYLLQSAPVVGADRLFPRQMLAGWVMGEAEMRSSDLRAALAALNVRVVVLPDGGAASGADAILAELGALYEDIPGGYALYHLPAWTN